MLDEHAPWMERRVHFSTLYITVRPPPEPIVTQGLTVVAPLTIFCGVGFDLIVVPISIQRSHKHWLEESVLTRLNPGGKLVIVDL